MLTARTDTSATRHDDSALPEASSPSRTRSPTRVRTLFISDIHLGTRACQAERLLEFLRHHEADTIYLVGDVMELWCLTTRRQWKPNHDRVMIELLKRARAGTRIVYIPGNHDYLVRRCAGQSFSGIEVELNAIHEAADGRRYLITHGDQFDMVQRYMPWLANIGHGAYHTLLELNTSINWVRRALGLDYWSLSEWLKYKVKKVVNHVSHFEESLSDEAREKRADGVICGHIHHAADRDLSGIRYLNTGDWVESCSGILEHTDGRMEIVRWTQAEYGKRQQPSRGEPSHVHESDWGGEYVGLDIVRNFQLRIHSALYCSSN